MRIAVVSDYETNGGAAIAATRLLREFAREGHEIRRFVFSPDKQRYGWTVDLGGPLPSSLPFRLVRKIAPRAVSYWMHGRSLRDLRKALIEFAPDVIHIHNLHSAWWTGAPNEVLHVCREVAPVVWTLHDMWSFTGCCAYSLECDAFLSDCSHDCPLARQYYPFRQRLVPGEWRKKRQALQSVPDAVAVAPSRWLAGLARKGLWRDHRVEVVANGIDPSTYSPTDRPSNRRRFGLQAGAPVILASFNSTPPYKGAEILMRLLDRYKGQLLQWVFLGSHLPKEYLAYSNVHSIGYLCDERDKSALFGCADLYIHASLAENLPNIIIECMLCGTPSLGFNVGGVSELIRPDQTGWLAKQPTLEGLEAGLFAALQSGFPEQMRSSCRTFAVANFSAHTQARKYLNIFEEIIGRA